MPRYNSQPTLPPGQPMPMAGMGNMGRSSALFPFTAGTNFNQAAAAAQRNPNPAAHPQMPQAGGLATASGIQQVAQQKLAGNEAPDWLDFGSLTPALKSACSRHGIVEGVKAGARGLQRFASIPSLSTNVVSWGKSAVDLASGGEHPSGSLDKLLLEKCGAGLLSSVMTTLPRIGLQHSVAPAIRATTAPKPSMPVTQPVAKPVVPAATPSAAQPAGGFSPGAAARDTAVAAGLSTAGTTGGLGLVALMTRKRMPFVSQLFSNAAKESLLFLNPKRSYQLLKRLPQASRLTASQMQVSDQLAGLKLPSGKLDELMTAASQAGQAAQRGDLQREYAKIKSVMDAVQAYRAQHGEMPGATLEKGLGVGNGLLNLGLGGGVGLLPHLGFGGNASAPNTASGTQLAAPAGANPSQISQLNKAGAAMKRASAPMPAVTSAPGLPVTGGGQPPQPMPQGGPMGVPPGAAPAGPPAAPGAMPPGAPMGGQPGMAPPPPQASVVPPMGEPPTQPLPSNPRIAPPRAPNAHDQQQQTTLDELLAAGQESRQDDNHEDITHDLMGMGAKIGGDLKTTFEIGREAVRMSPFDLLQTVFDKQAAQDNNQAQRSATGESKGLSYQHKPDHYAQGPAAWDSVQDYFKGGKKAGKPNLQTGKHAMDKEAVSPNYLMTLLQKAIGAHAAGKLPWDRVTQFAGKMNARRPGLVELPAIHPDSDQARMLNFAAYRKDPTIVRRLPQGVINASAPPSLPNMTSTAYSGLTPRQRYGLQKTSGFNHKDLDFMGKLGVTRRADGKIQPSNNLSTTEKVRHNQRVHTKTASRLEALRQRRDPNGISTQPIDVLLSKEAMNDWYANGGNEPKKKKKRKHWYDHVSDSMKLPLTDMLDKASADLTPFAQGFFAHCEALGFDESMMKLAVDRVGDEYGPEAKQELTDGLTKLAGRYDGLLNAGRGVVNWFSRSAPKAIPAARSAMAPAMKTTTEALKKNAPAFGQAAKQSLPGATMGGVGGMMEDAPVLDAQGKAVIDPNTGLPQQHDFWSWERMKRIGQGTVMGAAVYNPALGRVARNRFGGAGSVPLSMMQQRMVGDTIGNVGNMVTGRDDLDDWGRSLGTTFGAASGMGRMRYKMDKPNFGPANKPPMTELAGRMAAVGTKMENLNNQFARGGFAPLAAPFRAGRNLLMNGKLGDTGLAKAWRAGPASRAGMAMTALPIAGALGSAGLNAGRDYISGAVDQGIQHGVGNSIDTFYEPMMENMQGRMDNYLHEKGLLGDDGKAQLPGFDLSGLGGQLGGLSDKLFESLGMDPSRMSTIQKIMTIAGPLAALYGAGTGNHAMTGLGTLAAGYGLAPEIGRRLGPDAEKWLKSVGLSQGGTSGYMGSEVGAAGQAPGAAPNMSAGGAGPQARNEWDYQRQLQDAAVQRAQERAQSGGIDPSRLSEAQTMMLGAQ